MAVSDFYFPNKVLHKIQSTSSSSANEQETEKASSLILTLTPVPKVLKQLRTQWAPSAFVVSFKLETDPTLLRTKAEQAVAKYGVHMVVGNVLGSHHEVVHVLHSPLEEEINPTTSREWMMTKYPTLPRQQQQQQQQCQQFLLILQFRLARWNPI